MLVSSQIIIFSTLVYLAIMFYIAYRGDNQTTGTVSRYQPWIYTFSLTVYCSSWTFYGAVGSATHNGWDYFSIYLGPMIVFIFFFPFIRKLIAVSKRHKTTTIADFISTRYGKSRRLAAVVTIIAFLGSMPYIALQLKAISAAYDTLTLPQNVAHIPAFPDTAFSLAIVLSVFSILFGARTIDASEHHRGMLHAIAFESIVKLVAFLAIAFLALNIIQGVVAREGENTFLTEQLMQPFALYALSTAFFTKMLLAAGAIICLPRQFHVLAVEARGGEEASRWGVPLYLLLFSLAVIPITAAGILVVKGADSADLYVLLLPMLEGSNLLTIVSYLGGFAAATGMVIVANVALSTMVSNDLIFPLLLRYKKDFSERHVSATLLFIRRAIIFIMMLLAYGYYQIGGADKALYSVGLISFAAAIQFLPSIVGGLYWRTAHRNGALAGLLIGFFVWLYCLLLPSVAHSNWMPDTFSVLLLDQSSVLNPQQLFGIPFDDSLTHGVFWSLLFNTAFYIYFSYRSKPSLTDRLQASAYVDLSGTPMNDNTRHDYRFLVSDLFELCSRFTGADRTREYFLEHDYDVVRLGNQAADKEIQRLSERLLAQSIGTATAKHLIRSAAAPDRQVGKTFYELIDHTGQAIEFNRELLQVTLDHIGQAVSVVDQDLRLVAWNRYYIELFDYPENFISVGQSIEEVIRFNVQRGYGPIFSGEINSKIKERLDYLRHGQPYTFVRDWQNGLIIQTEGMRLPDGGYITTYTDITPLKKAERRLAANNETLEAKVEERTEMLSAVNQQLEEAINTKTHFLAAASHDLVQPLSASKLYMGALLEDLSNDEAKHALALSSFDALTTAESLLKSLLHLSKLDSGVLKADIQCFAISELFSAIENEFTVLAHQKGLRLRVVPSVVAIESDKSLMLSILQNLVANAIRYTESGSILIACRRTSGQLVRLEVKDSGRGIAPDKQEEIFHPFKQVDTANKDGVGLGLAICRQASILLGNMVAVRSRLGEGSTFSVDVPSVQIIDCKLGKLQRPPSFNKRWLEHMKILCVDDDHEILKASKSLLERWGAETKCVDTPDKLHDLLQSNERFDVVLMDYQLGRSDTGLDLLLACQQVYGKDFMGVLVTAEQSASIRDKTLENNFHFLSKPVEPAKLRALLQSDFLAESSTK